MAAKKNAQKQVTEKEVMEENNTKVDVKKIESEIEKAIDNVVSEVNENINEIKKQEAEIIKAIETNPESAKEIVNEEIKRVDEVIKNVEKQMDGYVKELKNKKINFTTISWNGWNYEH